MITCQHEWVQQCLIKYRFESLPDGEHWEDAHYPIPECQGGTETVRLWSRDHAVHGFLQSEDLDQICFHGYRRKTDRELIEKHYPEYLGVCDRWFSEAQRRAFKKRLSKDPEAQSKSVRKRWQDPKEKERASVRANALCESSKGIWGMSPEEKKKAEREGGRRGARTVNAQKWSDPDHPELGEHSAPTLAQMQKRRGYPHGKENRVRVG